MKALESPVVYMGCKSRIAVRLARLIEAEKPKRIFDLCCGTGAVSLALVTRGWDPSLLCLVDAGAWGALWQSVAIGTFPLARLEELASVCPKTQRLIQAWITRLALGEQEFCPAAFLLLQAAAFGGKPIRFAEGSWHGPGWKTVKDHWQAKNQFSAITPRPSVMLQRMRAIIERFPARAIHGDARSIVDQVNAGDVVYIDPPYDGTTGYGAELVDVDGLARQLADRGAVVLVSEAKPLSSEAYSLGRVRRGKVSGGPGNGSEEWISYFRPGLAPVVVAPAPRIEPAAPQLPESTDPELTELHATIARAQSNFVDRERQFAAMRETRAREAAAAAESARAYAVDARAPETRRAYSGQWSAFATWCEERGFPALPAAPSTVASYLAARADGGARPSSIDVALAAIAKAHSLAHHPNPRHAIEVREVRAGIRRRLGTRPKQKQPLPVDALRTIVGATRPGLLGLRDRALLLVGFAGGFRRSELVALDVADISFVTDGVEVLLRRAKTDQEGAGRKLGIPHGTVPATCPVRALAAWLDVSKVQEGPIFRQVRENAKLWDGGIGERLSSQAVARIVKEAAESVGFDPKLFSGHSLRAGLVTAAAKSHKSNRAIRRQTGHHSDRMVDEYVRDAQLLDDDNAAKGIGL